jgi:hypothetical protein
MKNLYILTLSVLITTISNAVVVTDYFTTTGTTENLIAAFDHSIEATTQNPYNGYIQLDFSGYGHNNPSEAFDAFWAVTNPPGTIKQGMGVAFDGNIVISGTTTFYDQDIGNDGAGWKIIYNDDVGLYDGINRNGFPSYKEDHNYTIVLELTDPNPRIVNFGFLDGGTSDNSGEVYISLTPVTMIPEPKYTFAVFIIFLVVLLTKTRRL